MFAQNYLQHMLNHREAIDTSEPAWAPMPRGLSPHKRGTGVEFTDPYDPSFSALHVKLRRFLYRGTDWVKDLHDFSYLSPDEGRQKIPSASM